MSKTMSEGQKAYEARRAAKAGVSLDKWLSQKERDREQEDEGEEGSHAAQGVRRARAGEPNLRPASHVQRERKTSLSRHSTSRLRRPKPCCFALA